MKKKWVVFILLLVVIVFILCCGILVIQPIGAIPEGATIVYWRLGLKIPFIASADGMLNKSNMGVSLLGRGMMLGELSKIIIPRKLFSLPYYEILYLISTGGKQYEN